MGPNIDLPRPWQRALKIPRKPQKFVFPTKWRRKLLPVPVFRHIRVLHPRLGLFSQKSQKNFQGHFFDIFGVKVENFKNILNELQEFPKKQFFDILRPLYPSTTVPKSIHFYREINFLTKCAFLDLADFWLIFRFFERIEVCAFISRKLNKLRGPSSYSPITLPIVY